MDHAPRVCVRRVPVCVRAMGRRIGPDAAHRAAMRPPHRLQSDRTARGAALSKMSYLPRTPLPRSCQGGTRCGNVKGWNRARMLQAGRFAASREQRLAGRSGRGRRGASTQRLVKPTLAARPHGLTASRSPSDPPPAVPAVPLPLTVLSVLSVPRAALLRVWGSGRVTPAERRYATDETATAGPLFNSWNEV